VLSQYLDCNWWAMWLGFWPWLPRDASSWISLVDAPDLLAAKASAWMEGPSVQPLAKNKQHMQSHWSFSQTAFE